MYAEAAPIELLLSFLKLPINFQSNLNLRVSPHDIVSQSLHFLDEPGLSL